MGEGVAAVEEVLVRVVNEEGSGIGVDEGATDELTTPPHVPKAALQPASQ